MAMSELEIDPDLDKAPPHVEGELLKRKTKAVISKWQKRFFVVHRDKLRYYSKKEDYKSGKEPLNVVRLLRVKDITESVFNGVPKKHHINSGFTVVELLPGGEEVVYHLLADTSDLMRYWVHALRYIKAYWSKLEVRETVISEEQEKKLLERLLREEEIEDDLVYVGEYSVDDNIRSGSAEWDTKQLCIPVYFADGSKVSVYTDIGESAGNIIEKVKDRLTSSASQIWVVNNEGETFPLNYNDAVILYHPSSHQFFLVDPTNRVLVVYIANVGKEFVATIVPHKITSREVIEHPDIAPKLDINGVTNRGLFLQKDNEALLFDSSECPCEALFTETVGGKIERRDLGSLVVRNKTLVQNRNSKKLRQTIRKHTKPSNSGADLVIHVLEEETDQRKALDKVQQLRDGKIKREPKRIESPGGSPRVRSRSKAFIASEETETLSANLKPRERSPSPIPSPRRIVTSGSPPTKRQVITVKKQVRRAEEGNVYMNESRSSAFGLVSESERKGSWQKEEEERLADLFSASYQEREEQRQEEEKMRQEEEQLKQKISPINTSLNNPLQSLGKTESIEDQKEMSSLKPFVLSVDSLSQYSMTTTTKDDPTPVIIHKPSILKVVLLQTDATNDSNSTPSGAIKLISMSGVVLNYKDRKWRLYNDSRYHDVPSHEVLSKCEMFTLSGGIRAVYDANQMCWYVLPPVSSSPSTPSSSSPILGTTDGNGAAVQQSIDNALAQMNVTTSDSFYNMKRSIATNIGSSFMTILNQFSGSLSADEKKKTASDMTNERLGHMFRGSFCTSIAALILDGVKLQKLGGLIHYDVWKLINIFCQEGLNMSEPTAVSLSIESQVTKPIKGEGRLVTGDMKFRSFICLAISRGLFLQWLTELPLMGDTLKKHYSKDSLLYLVHIGDPLYSKLYEEILLSLQPMSFFPFQLSIDFEIKLAEKSNTATGPSEHHEEVKKGGESTSIINESHERIITPSNSTSSGGGINLLANTIMGKSKPQWFKSLTYNLTNLNMGGVLTGPAPPSSSSLNTTPTNTEVPKEEQTPPTEQDQQVSWDVVALYDCTADNEDELSFQKGDILKVKKEINGDWLFCTKGNDKGIVPMSFVKKCQ